MSTRAARITEVRRVVSTETFLAGAQEHTDGLAGYVRDFLAEYGGTPNERGREWTPESCANALKIPPPTLRRWLDLQEPTPVSNQKPAAQKVARSHARAVTRDPEQRREFVKSLPAETRDGLMGDLIEVQNPETRQCRHCPEHCPGRG